MDIFPADLRWDRSKGTQVPKIPHCAIAILERSGIGEALLNQDHTRGIYILEKTCIEGLQEVLDGEPWSGTKDQLPLVKALLDYIEQHPDQRMYCFMVTES